MAVREPVSYFKKGFWGSVVQVGPAPYIDRGPGHYQADNTEFIRPGGDTGNGQAPSQTPFVHAPFVEDGYYNQNQFNVRGQRIGSRRREFLKSMTQNPDPSIDDYEHEMMNRITNQKQRPLDMFDSDWVSLVAGPDLPPGMVAKPNPAIPFPK